MANKLTPDFWKFYDKASEKLQQDPEWQELEYKVGAFIKAAPNSDILETDLVNLIDQQYIMLMAEMFKMLKYK